MRPVRVPTVVPTKGDGQCAVSYWCSKTARPPASPTRHHRRSRSAAASASCRRGSRCTSTSTRHSSRADEGVGCRRVAALRPDAGRAVLHDSLWVHSPDASSSVIWAPSCLSAQSSSHGIRRASSLVAIVVYVPSGMATDREGVGVGPGVADGSATDVVGAATDVALGPGVAAQAPTSPHARSKASPRGIAWVVLIMWCTSRSSLVRLTLIGRSCAGRSLEAPRSSGESPIDWRRAGADYPRMRPSFQRAAVLAMMIMNLSACGPAVPPSTQTWP